MPGATTIELGGLPELRRVLRRHNIRLNPRITANALRRTAYAAQRNAALKQIIRGGPRGAPPHPRRLTSRTGRLRGSIGVDFSELPVAVTVGTAVRYGRVHELGLGRFPRRAFLQPAADEEAPRFADHCYNEWRKGTFG